MPYHSPVLLGPAVGALMTDLSGTYVDATFGGGGHACAILGRLHDGGRLIAFDQDGDCRPNLPDDARLQFVAANFRHLLRFLKYYHACPVDGILADLGVSSHQLDTPERGFSYLSDGRLDMRMNTAAGMTAEDIVNTYDESALGRIFHQYGELHNANRLARAIVQARQSRSIATTRQLAEALAPALPGNREYKCLSKIFQALRIEVNREMEALEAFLTQAAEALKPGGRLAVISYHSLEDRLVKNFMRAGNAGGEVEKDMFGNPLAPLKPVNRKPVVPDAEEVNANPRARSAKLRVAEKTKDVKP